MAPKQTNSPGKPIPAKSGIALISLVSLCTASLPVSVIAAFKEDSTAGFAILLFLMIVANAILPTLVSAYVFYRLVKRTGAVTRFAEKAKVAILFILTCELLFTLWAVGEWLISGNPTAAGFSKIYNRDFAGWNYILLLNGILIPVLYFSNFLSAFNPSPRRAPGDQNSGNEQ
jgi:hypothetical protein